MRPALVLVLTVTACRAAAAPPPPAAAPPAAAPPPAADRAPITLTYLGVAGWQLDGGDRTILADPYFSRPDLDAPIVPDAAAIAARAPATVDLIVVGHSHVDHLLDAPPIARTTGAELMGSVSTARVARASGVPDDQIITIQGGEDYAFDGYSVRVLRSLHSALDDKHTFGDEITAVPTLPMRFADYAEGGAFAYLVRVAGHQVLFLSTANFIERELDGLRPDVAVIATGLRHEIHDYTCRLMRALGNPPRVYANHFDDWRGPPVDVAPSEDLQAFVAEVARCAPHTQVVVPKHFTPMIVP